MGPEIPKNAVIVEVEQSLEERLKEHPLGPGQVYYFVSSQSADGLPNKFNLAGIYSELNQEFNMLRTRSLIEGQISSILLHDEIHAFINGQTDQNS